MQPWRRYLLAVCSPLLLGAGCTIENITIHDDGSFDIALDWALEELVVEPETTEHALATDSNVVRVVDGDTVVVDLDGEEVTVRIIGINTPETVDPRKPVECFGREASERAKELMTGNTIELTSDASQGDVDNYGRLLRYITLPDGSDFGARMISEGLAYEYTYKKPYDRQGEYKVAQQKAEQDVLGLWEPGACN
ncbi:thermonuclease family protein [Patescibacteria group bacterium]|nr:thermonuclease family protein [Patescibacteria group bacterium]